MATARGATIVPAVMWEYEPPMSSTAENGARHLLAIGVGGTFADVIRHDSVSAAVGVAQTAPTADDAVLRREIDVRYYGHGTA